MGSCCSSPRRTNEILLCDIKRKEYKYEGWIALPPLPDEVQQILARGAVKKEQVLKNANIVKWLENADNELFKAVEALTKIKVSSASSALVYFRSLCNLHIFATKVLPPGSCGEKLAAFDWNVFVDIFVSCGNVIVSDANPVSRDTAGFWWAQAISEILSLSSTTEEQENEDEGAEREDEKDGKKHSCAKFYSKEVMLSWCAVASGSVNSSSTSYTFARAGLFLLPRNEQVLMWKEEQEEENLTDALTILKLRASTGFALSKFAALKKKLGLMNDDNNNVHEEEEEKESVSAVGGMNAVLPPPPQFQD